MLARAMEHYSIIDHSVTDRPVGDQAVGEQAASERSASEPAVSERAVSKQGSPRPGEEPELETTELESGLEQEVAHSDVSRLNPSVSAGIAAANALAASGTPGEAGWHVSPRFSGEDGGHSMAEMAQRDLDAALQLLADRAQYITGAGGAAIALRRDQSNDMLCRASSGDKAPELGALLSTESGLSGESVRTRMPLRCDDAERDPRVNQESCRRLGIASVMIVPIVGQDSAGDDQVLGVFELFSGQAGAFEERDLSALQRLGEMVETAVKLARAAQGVPPEMVAPDMAIDAADLILPDQAPSDILSEITTEVTGVPRGTPGVLESAGFADEGPVLEVEVDDVATELPREAVAAASVEVGADAAMTAALEVDSAHPVLQPQGASARVPPVSVPPTGVPPMAVPPKAVPPATVVPAVIPPVAVPAAIAASIPPVAVPANVVPAQEQPMKRPLMWSAAAQGGPEAAKAAELDQSNVPPMLRNLRKCKACGFPVSEGRTLCVECDEKQWRGQPLPAGAKGRGGGPAVDFRQTGSLSAPSVGIAPSKVATAPVAANLKSIAEPVPGETISQSAFSSGPQSLFAADSERTERGTRVEATRVPVAVPAGAGASLGGSSAKAPAQASVQPPVLPSAPTAGARSGASVLVEPAVRQAQNRLATPNFSGGLGTSESWLSRNKYVVGTILLIAAVLAAVAWLR
jgi:hypothetical protein